jgi:flagellar basal body-associated protein FliL
MARRRRPSIPLIILFIILLLLFLLAGTLVQIASEFAGRGSFTYTYVAGNEPIVSITYTLPQDLADALVPKQTAGWTVNLANNVLSLTSGTLNPGGSVTVDYRLSKYIAGGTRTITATSTTSSGSTQTIQTPLPVPEAFLLAMMWMLYQNAIWLLILAIIVLVVIIVLFIRGKKKDKEQEQKEVTSPQKPA